MDLFKFNPTGTPSILQRGELVNGARSKLWTERYRDPGEFVISSPLSVGLKDILPLGTIVSHQDSLEPMFVESHQIIDEPDTDPTMSISGRSLDAWLGNRIVGANENWATHTGPKIEYLMASDSSWHQAVSLINAHISTAVVAADRLSNVVAQTSLTTGGTQEERVIARGSLHERVLEILDVDDLGIKTIRRNPFGVGSPTETRFVIHNGVDKSDSVIFSSEAGDIVSGEYLWSLKRSKNAALVSGRYVETAVIPAATGYDRRWMFVDAEDIDGDLSSAPTGGALTAVRNKMIVRGQQALRAQNEINITRSDISNLSQYRYRIDYNIGDIVSVDGNYGEMEKRRVVEFVEVEDENGTSGHPSLAVI